MKRRAMPFPFFLARYIGTHVAIIIVHSRLTPLYYVVALSRSHRASHVVAPRPQRRPLGDCSTKPPSHRRALYRSRVSARCHYAMRSICRRHHACAYYFAPGELAVTRGAAAGPPAAQRAVLACHEHAHRCTAAVTGRASPPRAPLSPLPSSSLASG